MVYCTSCRCTIIDVSNAYICECSICVMAPVDVPWVCENCISNFHTCTSCGDLLCISNGTQATEGGLCSTCHDIQLDVCACGGSLYENGRHCLCTVCRNIRGTFEWCVHCSSDCTSPMPDINHGVCQSCSVRLPGILTGATGLPRDIIGLVSAMDATVEVAVSQKRRRTTGGSHRARRLLHLLD